ncbi:MAG: hypothetical protein JRH19_23255, partial [Deltaproteobacteria bacterium]|nr:hypothetical protein [Deltaproteobacteria bacterium]
MTARLLLSLRAPQALFLCGLLIATSCGDSRTDSPAPVRAPAATAAIDAWTEPEIALLESLAIGALQPPPPQASNRVADDRKAAELGHRLFFAPQLSGDGRVSCATCHVLHRRPKDLAWSRGHDTQRAYPRGQRPLALDVLGRAPGQSVGAGARATRGRGRDGQHARGGRAPCRYGSVVGAALPAGFRERVWARRRHPTPRASGPLRRLRRAGGLAAHDRRGSPRRRCGLREHRQGHRRLRAPDRARSVALRSLRGAAPRRQPGGNGSDLERRGDPRSTPLRRCRADTLPALPQRSAAHEPELPPGGHGDRGGGAAGLWPLPGNPGCPDRSLQLPRQLQRREPATVRGAPLPGQEPRRWGDGQVQDAYPTGPAAHGPLYARRSFRLPGRSHRALSVASGRRSVHGDHASRARRRREPRPCGLPLQPRWRRGSGGSL